jgi:hypothetical protein
MGKKSKTKRAKPKEKKPEGKAQAQAVELVFCQRIQEPVSVGEHKKCPYCFGTIEAIADGCHEDFCDYDPDRDPLQFGFPFK